MIEIRILGPVHLYERDPTLGARMSALTDAVGALVAEDGAVVAALNDLKAKADANGSVSAADVQSAVDTVNGEVSKLSAAVAADDPDLPGASVTGTGAASAPGSAPGDPAVPTAPPAPTEPNAPETVVTNPAEPVSDTPSDAPAEPVAPPVPVDPPAAETSTPASEAAPQ